MFPFSTSFQMFSPIRSLSSPSHAFQVALPTSFTFEKSPRVTRDRLYIEAVENVLGRSQKVLVDTKGNNQMLYLPLDKLIEQQRRNAEPEVSVTAPRASAGANAEQSAPDPRARVER